MSAFFITGIGTGVGKTYLLCAWIRYLKKHNKKVHAIKPIISGYSSQDCDTHLIFNHLTDNHVLSIETISPWRFLAPISPHLAAKQENTEIVFQDLIDYCMNQITHAKNAQAHLLIEGVGGVAVPLSDQFLVIDWIKRINIPTVLVVSNYLGALNHTISQYFMLKAYGILNIVIVINEMPLCSIEVNDMVTTFKCFMPLASVFTMTEWFNQMA